MNNHKEETAIDLLGSFSSDLIMILNSMEVLDRLLTVVDMEWGRNPKKCKAEFALAFSLYGIIQKSASLLGLRMTDAAIDLEDKA